MTHTSLFKPKTKLIMFLIFFLLVSILVVIFFYSFSRVSTQALREEFGAAYSADIERDGSVVEVDIIAGKDRIEIIDGVQTDIWSYTNQPPNNPIKITLGDTLRATLTNNLTEETTIHWHGVRVDNTMDGVPGINQYPVKPGETFIYEITPKDAGTYWYHPHLNGTEQLDRGLYAPLIVMDNKPKPYTQDVVWMVDDWRLDNGGQIVSDFNNGHDVSHDGRWGNLISVNRETDNTLSARPGERIRLRLINSSNARVYRPSFKNLDAQVIAVDGQYVKNVFSLADFEMAPGNRLDLDISIPKDAQESSHTLSDSYTDQTLNLATIKISGEAVSTPEFDYPTNPHIPDWRDAVKAPVNIKFSLSNSPSRASMMGGMSHMMASDWAINNKQYPDYKLSNFQYDTFNKISITNNSLRLHPMHLHGVFFKIVSKNGKAVQEGFFRDTILLKANETVELAFVPFDKGNWAMHCHIQLHADRGMMSVFRV